MKPQLRLMTKRPEGMVLLDWWRFYLRQILSGHSYHFAAIDQTIRKYGGREQAEKLV